MKKNIYKIILFIAFGFFIGCENDITKIEDEFDPGADLPQPVVNSISPAGLAVAGVDAIELTGSNFSADINQNLVYFGSVKAKVLEASPSRLLVRAPNNPAETLMVKVTLLKDAALYSDAHQYKLLPAAADVFVKTGRKIFAITVDQNENIFASATENDAGIGVIKIAPDGTVTEFAPSGETFLQTIKIGPNGNIYGLRPNLRAIFEIQPGVASKSFVALPAGQIADIDFDKDHYLWAGGRNMNNLLYRVTLADKTVQTFPFIGDVRAIKATNDYLYVAALRDGQEKVFRFSLSAGVLGAEEEYYNMTTKYPNRVINTMLISQSGKIYLGTNSTKPEDFFGKPDNFPILVINPDKSDEIMFNPMVPDKVFAGPVASMAWGAGEYFYFTRTKLDATNPDGTKTTVQNQEIVKVTARDVSVPYYGRGDQ